MTSEGMWGGGKGGLKGEECGGVWKARRRAWGRVGGRRQGWGRLGGQVRIGRCVEYRVAWGGKEGEVMGSIGR